MVTFHEDVLVDLVRSEQCLQILLVELQLHVASRQCEHLLVQLVNSSLRLHQLLPREIQVLPHLQVYSIGDRLLREGDGVLAEACGQDISRGDFPRLTLWLLTTRRRRPPDEVAQRGGLPRLRALALRRLRRLLVFLHFYLIK